MHDIRSIFLFFLYIPTDEKPGYAGVGLYSKEKPISVKYGLGPDHDAEGRLITAEFEKFYIMSCYTPNAGRKLVTLDKKLKWNEDFLKYMKELDAKKPVILAGDLNVSHQEMDLARPKTNTKSAGFTKEERDDFTKLLEEGFVDAFRHLYPDKKDAYTYWTYLANARANNVGWRLDYFVVSKKLLPNVCDSIIRSHVLGSDHCPLILNMHF
jgi:AP endonuclease 1